MRYYLLSKQLVATEGMT